MRLHNRMVKATFWTDTDLIRQFSRDIRLFYEGLWQLADDSGCMENDPWAFKLHLFPLDDDLTPTILHEWARQLLSAGKLISYQSGGKDCYFVSNFHKHQPIKNPAPPEVPLPEWVKWEPYGSNSRAGHYIIEVPYECLTPFLPITDEVLLTEPRTEPRKEPGREPQRKETVSKASDSAGALITPMPSKDANPLSEDESYYLQINGLKRFSKPRAQRPFITKIVDECGSEVFRRAVDWLAVRGKSDLNAIATCAKKMATGPPPPVKSAGFGLQEDTSVMVNRVLAKMEKGESFLGN